MVKTLHFHCRGECSIPHGLSPKIKVFTFSKSKKVFKKKLRQKERKKRRKGREEEAKKEEVKKKKKCVRMVKIPKLVAD